MKNSSEKQRTFTKVSWYGSEKLIEEEDTVNVDEDLPISSDMFFDVFPFHLVFSKSMVVRSVGSGIEAIMPNISNQPIDEMFMLTRPLVEFSLDNVRVISYCSSGLNKLSVTLLLQVTSRKHAHVG